MLLLSRKRGGDSSSGVSDRVLAQLLTEIDGLEKSTNVIVLAATNRPEILDGAILRPGRLDRSLYVSLPDKDTRHAIIELQLKKMSAIDADIDTNLLAIRTDGYSGAEIVALCKNAAFLAMRDNLHSAQIESKHFEAALSIIVARTNRKTLEIYEKFEKGIQL
jgi:SpoVK/Ycf46/Vps4 family AAA+-type ATPase